MAIKKLHVNEIVKSVSETHPMKCRKLLAINTSDILSGDILQATLTDVDELKGQFKKTIRKDDILFSEIRPANRRFARVNYENVAEYIVSTKLMVLRKYNDDVDLDYFYYWLTHNELLNVLQARAENRICSFPQITFELLSEYKVPVPSLVIQKQIGSFFKAIDEKVETNNEILKEFSNVGRAIFQHWFLQYDFPLNGKPYKASGGVMRYDKKLKREVPASWQTVRCGELFETNRGVSYSTPDIETGDGVPMINLATFGVDGQYKADGIKFYSGNYSSDKLLHPYDLVMCNTQQTAIDYDKDIIGKAIIVPDVFGEGDIVSSHHVNVIKTYKLSLIHI